MFLRKKKTGEAGRCWFRIKFYTKAERDLAKTESRLEKERTHIVSSLNLY